MSAREDILQRIRAATNGSTNSVLDAGMPPHSRLTEDGASAAQSGGSPGAASEARALTLTLFAETVADYRAEVIRVADDAIATAVLTALGGAASVVCPPGLDRSWLGEVEASRLVADTPLSAHELDAVDAVVTAAALGIATTGTIVLDHGPDQGRRALTLVPDLHVCVVRESQVVHDVPDAVARLHSQGQQRPLTWVSGPSATSDIELDRVEGVHGPRTLIVILAP